MSASQHLFEDTNSRGVAHDSEDAFEQIFRAYFRKLAHFAYQLVKDESAAKDVAQDAFVTYWNNRNEVSAHEKAIRNFLYTTVRNSCLNILRHNKVVDQYRGAQDPEPVDEFNIIHALVRSEVLTEIYAAIETLPESCRRISRMGYLEGLKNKEIAQALGVSVNTVKTQKKRGLQLLRLRLDPRYLFFFFVSGL